MLNHSLSLLFYSVFILYGSGGVGKYNIRANGIRECKGPRSVDCGHVKHIVRPGGLFVDVHMYVPADTYMDSIDVISYKTGLGRNSATFNNWHMGNPCEQPFLRESIRTWVGSGKNCVIKKGNYNYTVDLKAIAQKLWPDSFFYGNLTFESSFVGPTCNLGCSQLNITISPKK